MYFNARYYAKELGRFMSCDPIKSVSSTLVINPYVYCANNPISYTDPTGLMPAPDPPNIIDGDNDGGYFNQLENYIDEDLAEPDTSGLESGGGDMGVDTSGGLDTQASVNMSLEEANNTLSASGVDPSIFEGEGDNILIFEGYSEGDEGGAYEDFGKNIDALEDASTNCYSNDTVRVRVESLKEMRDVWNALKAVGVEIDSTVCMAHAVLNGGFVFDKVGNEWKVYPVNKGKSIKSNSTFKEGVSEKVFIIDCHTKQDNAMREAFANTGSEVHMFDNTEYTHPGTVPGTDLFQFQGGKPGNPGFNKANGGLNFYLNAIGGDLGSYYKYYDQH